MKKFLALMLALVMVLSLAACGKQGGGSAASVDVESPEALLSAVFEGYAEDEKFPIAGGDAVNMVMDAPGAMDMADLETIDFMVGLPADAAAHVDAVASALHMMNANTFTAGCYRVSDSANMDAVVKALKAIDYSGWFTLEAVNYLADFNQDTVFEGVCNLANAAKKLAGMFEAIQ